MKKLIMTTGLILSLLTGQAVLASPTIEVTVDETIDVITVVAQHDPTDFAVFSLGHAEQALDNAMDYMVDSIVTTDDVAGRLDVAVNTGS